MNEKIEARKNKLEEKKGVYEQILITMIDNNLDSVIINEIYHQIYVIKQEIRRCAQWLDVTK